MTSPTRRVVHSSARRTQTERQTRHLSDEIPLPFLPHSSSPQLKLTPPFHSWGNRRANGYQALAEDGYALLAERLRSSQERAVVHSVLERVLRVKLDMNAVYEKDAAEAAEKLAARLAESPDHEFAVRFFSLWLCFFSFSGSVWGVKEMRDMGLKLHKQCGCIPKIQDRNHRV
jgi:hypothetical protein